MVLSCYTANVITLRLQTVSFQPRIFFKMNLGWATSPLFEEYIKNHYLPASSVQLHL